MAADVESGPVVQRSHIGGGLGVGRAGREIGGKCWRGRAEGDESHSCRESLLHWFSPERLLLFKRRAFCAVHGLHLASFCLKSCHSNATAGHNPTCCRTTEICF